MIIFLVTFLIQACEKDPITYVPLQLEDWSVSGPQAQGLDSTLLHDLYQDASEIDHLYSLLVVKNDFLVAEKYFNGKNEYSAEPIASVTKSYTSALTGIAIEKGFISGLDEHIAGFFPEFDWDKMDSRKSEITIEQILQMRSGYPWEEFSPYHDLLWARFRNWLPLIEEIPLENDPGTDYGYSNLMSHVLGIVIARAADTSLLDFARAYLCEPLGVSIPTWWSDSLGYNYGHGDIHSTARDMARFGTLYLNLGFYNNSQILPSWWVESSLDSYSFNIYGREILESIHQINLGYMNWFSGKAGDHQFYFSWGHGGQLIFLLQDLNMVIVTTADYLPGAFGEDAWKKEKSVLDLIGKYISLL